MIAQIGAGGMGEVYRARDTRLDRTVAIKVLPAQVAADPELRQRFEREARAVSSLNHPNICTLHDVGSQDGVDFLVMEYLEGGTLADQLATGPLPLAQGIATAIQVADALDKAHRHGIVHRDLKPGNVMLTKSGVKLLDFGLAKLRPAAASGLPELTAVATVSSPLTGAGTILGTVQYMAPEQLEGREADARTDIFALGAVLYEMFAGRRAFEGASQASVIAAIMHIQPPALAAAAPLTPPLLDRLVARCLMKEPDQRFQSAHDILIALRWIEEAAAAAPAAHGTTEAAPRFNRLARFAVVPLAIATVILALLYAGEARSRSAAAGGTTAAVSRLSITLPASAPLVPPAGGGMGRLAISPDGREIVYLGGTAFVRGGGDGNDSQLYRRSLDRLDVEPILGTQGASSPFFSPDGRTLGFFFSRAVQRVSASGGLPVTIAESPFPPSRGAAWTRDDAIFFGILGGDLWRVPASGGTPVLVAGPDALRRDKELTRRYPSPLPDGRTLLYVALPSSATAFASGFDFNAAHIMALDQQTSRTRLLLTGGFAPRYVSSGHLVFAREDGLYAVPFDVTTLALRGEAVKVLGGASTFSGNGFADFAVSAGGTLVYAPGGDFKDFATGTTVVWVDREGHERPLAHWNNAFNQGRLSADGTRLVVHGNSAISDVGIHDIARGVLARLTDTPAGGSSPVWTSDQQGITYTRPDPAFVAGPYTLVTTSADGSGVERTLLQRPFPVAAESWAPDGKALAFTETAATTGADIWVLPDAGDRSPVPIATSRAAEQHPRFSPDGRWIVYQSNESGQNEIFVRAWPLTGGVKYQVSAGGGTNPEWAPAGREIVYQRGTAVVRVAVEPGATAFAAKPPLTLFERPLGGQLLGVAPDGQAFVMTGSVAEQKRPAGRELIVVENWGEELKRLVPAR